MKCYIKQNLKFRQNPSECTLSNELDILLINQLCWEILNSLEYSCLTSAVYTYPNQMSKVLGGKSLLIGGQSQAAAFAHLKKQIHIER